MRTISNKEKMRLMELPLEILLDIFKRLPVKSVCCIRSASKTLLEMVDSPHFISLHSRTLIATNAVAEAPQLMLRLVRSHCGTTHRALMTLQSLNYDGSKGNLTVSEILSTSHEHRYTIYSVFNNLFFFKNRSKDDQLCFLIDPFRGEVLRLQSSNILHTKYGENISTWQQCYGMGFDNITSTYKIVRLSEVYDLDTWKSHIVAQVHVLGTSSWHEIPPPFGPSWGSFHFNKSVCAYGDVHWLFHEDAKGLHHIISFDFTKEEFYSTPQPPTFQNLGLRYVKFITLRGSMAVVDTSSGKHIYVWVMKDYNKKEWTLEYNINLQMFEPDLQKKIQDANYCGEWENGIFFILDPTSFFFDLRHVPVDCVECPIETKSWRRFGRILSLKRSLISLKKFGNLIQEPEPGSQSLLDFSKKYLWQQPDY